MMGLLGVSVKVLSNIISGFGACAVEQKEV